MAFDCFPAEGYFEISLGFLKMVFGKWWKLSDRPCNTAERYFEIFLDFLKLLSKKLDGCAKVGTVVIGVGG